MATPFDSNAGFDSSDLLLPLKGKWVRCSDAMPWCDLRSYLNYVVYAPAYRNELLICRFLSSDSAWWHERYMIGITGVTYWRLAETGEEDFSAAKDQMPKAGPVADRWDLAALNQWRVIEQKRQVNRS